MARRQLEEINAGSMADIAFLLLIFFLVTTTMEVDAGISRNLPLKFDPPEGWVPPEVHERDVLVIMANSNDELLVEGKPLLLEDLEEKVRAFFLDNANGQDNNPDMPMYRNISGAICQKNVTEIKALIASAPNEGMAKLYEGDLKKWEGKLQTVKEIGDYYEISNSSLIQLKNQSNTSFGLYIEVQDILKKVVNDLRNDKSKELFDVEYKDLDPKDEADAAKIAVLQILVPERIVAAKIEI